MMVEVYALRAATVWQHARADLDEKQPAGVVLYELAPHKV
jgi:hypothetical protein